MLSRNISALVVCALVVFGFSSLTFADEPVVVEKTETPSSSVMPEDWQNLDALSFVTAFEKVIKKRPYPTAEHSKEITAHVWNKFLNNADFVAEGNWQATSKMLKHFIRRQKLLVEVETEEVKKASKAKLEKNLEVLSARVAVRLEAHPETLTSLSFEDMRKSFWCLYPTGFTRRDSAAWCAKWMKVNPWKESPLVTQAHLFGFINHDDMNKKYFSVRWTGNITVPATDTYTFEQIRTYFTDGKMKLWINGQLVLDSPGTGPEQGRCNPRPKIDDPTYRSKPISLMANHKADFRLEYVHDMTGVKFYGRRPTGVPVAVLLWKSPVLEQQIVPGSAFTPPSGFTEKKTSGLKAEYYSDGKFTEKKATRLDPAVDFVWKRNAVHHEFMAARDEILAEVFPKLTSSTFLASIASSKDPKDKTVLMNTSFHRFFFGMTASQKIKALQAIKTQPTLLKELKHTTFNYLMESMHMLPGDEHVKMFIAWSKAIPQPRNNPCRVPGWGRGSYCYNNCHQVWTLGRYFSTVFFDETQRMWESDLELENGECNLMLAYVTIFASKYTDKNLAVFKVLDDRLADKELTGNARATWLFARAYAAEAAIARSLRPGRGIPYVKEALAAAETPEYRFWVMQELVARLIAVDRCQEAQSLMASLSGQFSDKVQQKQIARWTKYAKGLSSKYEQLRQKAKQSSRNAYITEIRRRKTNAEKREDQTMATRYGQIIERHEAAQKAEVEAAAAKAAAKAEAKAKTAAEAATAQ